jgi:hypothetical protein
MSDQLNSPGPGGEYSNSLPGWIISGILGLAIGAATTVLGMYGYGYRLPESGGSEPAVPAAGAALPAMPAGGGLAGPGGGGPPAGMGMGGMGGGGGGGKRNLTALVGKLELLSRPSLNLHLELAAEQVKKIAARLEELEKAETMTGDEAQSHLDALEELLTLEQKETLGLIGLPGGRGGGGGGPGAAGRPGGGGPPGAGGPPAGGGPPMMGMMGMGGAPPDENPFTQESNQKRLRDLLSRLAPPAAESEGASP